MTYRDIRITGIVLGMTLMSFVAAYSLTRLVCDLIFV